MAELLVTVVQVHGESTPQWLCSAALMPGTGLSSDCGAKTVLTPPAIRNKVHMYACDLVQCRFLAMSMENGLQLGPYTWFGYLWQSLTHSDRSGTVGIFVAFIKYV